MILLTALCLSASAGALPDPLPSTPWSPPSPALRQLSNGLPVWILPARSSGTFEIRLVLKTGAQHDPQGLEGLAAVTFDLADEGAGELDAAAFQSAARALGAEVTAASAGDTSTVTVRGLRRNLEPALDLWALALTRPALDASDLELVVQRHVDRVKLQQREPAGMADRVQAAVQYGEDYLGRSPTEASLRAITAERARAFWAEQVVPSGAAVIAGGDLSAEELLPLLEARLGDWKGPAEGAGAARAEAKPLSRSETLYLADVPGAPQSALRAFVPLPGPGAPLPDRAALDVGIEILGAAFTSRVNRNLRESKGWTYGARCRPIYREGHGFLECATLVRADVTADALQELRRELREIVGERPITEEELPVFRDGLRASWLAEHETTGALANEAASAWRRDLPPDFASRYLAALGKVDRKAAQEALRTHLVTGEVTWVVAGDLAKIRASLEALDLPMETLP